MRTTRLLGEDVMSLLRFMRIAWPKQFAALLTVSVDDVQFVP
jgi:hypothetical protein